MGTYRPLQHYGGIVVLGGQKKFKMKYILVTTAALVYGIAMEFIQQYFVVNRSFDTGDIVADAIGCLIGYGFSWKYIKK